MQKLLPYEYKIAFLKRSDIMSYDSYSTSEGLAAFFAVFIAYFLIIGIIALVIAILQIVGQWKAFKKAGKGGWEAIVPVYNVIVCCQITGVNPW